MKEEQGSRGRTPKIGKRGLNRSNSSRYPISTMGTNEKGQKSRDRRKTISREDNDIHYGETSPTGTGLKLFDDILISYK